MPDLCGTAMVIFFYILRSDIRNFLYVRHSVNKSASIKSLNLTPCQNLWSTYFFLSSKECSPEYAKLSMHFCGQTHLEFGSAIVIDY